MKVIIDGKEKELIDEYIPGEIELDLLNPDINKEKNIIDLEDTIKLTEEEIKQINEEETYNE